MLMMFSPSTTIVASARSGLTPSNSSPSTIVVRAWLLIADPFWPVYPAALHNEFGVGQRGEVEHRVPRHEHEVGELSRLDRADAVIHAEQRRRVTGGGLHGIHGARTVRSEEHTSELQSPCNLVCRLLLEKKKKKTKRLKHLLQKKKKKKNK